MLVKNQKNHRIFRASRNSYKYNMRGPCYSVNTLGRVIIVTLSQNHEYQSPDELEKFVREQIESSKIPQQCCLEKVQVLEDPFSKDSSVIHATPT